MSINFKTLVLLSDRLKKVQSALSKSSDEYAVLSSSINNIIQSNFDSTKYYTKTDIDGNFRTSTQVNSAIAGFDFSSDNNSSINNRFGLHYTKTDIDGKGFKNDSGVVNLIQNHNFSLFPNSSLNTALDTKASSLNISASFTTPAQVSGGIATHPSILAKADSVAVSASFTTTAQVVDRIGGFDFSSNANPSLNSRLGLHYTKTDIDSKGFKDSTGVTNLIKGHDFTLNPNATLNIKLDAKTDFSTFGQHTSSILTYTSSNNTNIGNLNLHTASALTKFGSLDQHTASALTRFGNLDQHTASILTYTGSNDTRYGNLSSSHVNLKTDHNTLSSSHISYTASFNQHTASILSYTSSNNTNINNLNIHTASAITRLGSLDAHTASILIYTGSNDTKYGNLSASHIGLSGSHVSLSTAHTTLNNTYNTFYNNHGYKLNALAYSDAEETNYKAGYIITHNNQTFPVTGVLTPAGYPQNYWWYTIVSPTASSDFKLFSYSYKGYNQNKPVGDTYNQELFLGYRKRMYDPASAFGTTTQNSELRLQADNIYLQNGTSNRINPTVTIVGDMNTAVGTSNQGQLYVQDEDDTASGLYLGYSSTGNIGSRIQSLTGSSVQTLFINNAGGDMYLGSGNYWTYYGCVKVGPLTDNYTSLGDATHRFKDVWSINGTIQTSDARQKTNISGSDLGLEFINSLEPVKYKFIVGQNELVNKEDGTQEIVARPGVRTHYGFIAQNVQEKLNGIDFAGFIYDSGSDSYGLRYEEFIAPMAKAIQELSAENKLLKAKLEEKDAQISDILSRLSSLENK